MKNLQKYISSLLAFTLSLGLTPQTIHAAGGIGGTPITPGSTYTPPAEEEEEEEVYVEPLFPDIEFHWAREYIETMVNLGYFVGMDEVTFAPDKNMTRAEFIVVIVNYLYPTADFAVQEPYWYSGYYDTASKEGILPSTFRAQYLDQEITRQEMALILVNTFDEEPEDLVSTATIPDYGLVTKSTTDDYRGAVLSVYSLGLMSGKETDGSFCPNDFATRAEACTVLLNFIDPEYRVEVEFEPDPNALTDMNRMDIDFTKKRENMTIDLSDSERPIVKVGDTVIISGKEYPVVAHPSGAAVSKVNVPYVEGMALDNGINTNSTHGTVAHNWSGGGVHHGGDTYYVNPNTKEGFWSSEWDAILTRWPAPTKPGTTDGETDDRKNWTWSTAQSKWVPSYSYTKGK